MIRVLVPGRIAIGVLLLCMLGVSFSARAQHGSFTPAEIASLPQYCQDLFSGDKNRMAKWKSTLPGDLRHFCQALIYFSRASMSFDAKRRSQYAQYGIGNLNYALQRWPSSHPLFQQAQIYKSQLEMMRK